MSRLARLSLVTTALAFLTAAAGGLVRATGSGLGCPGWPKCFGRWIPPADHHAWIEMTHRYLVAFLSCGVIAVTVLAVLGSKGSAPGARRTRWLGLSLVPLIAAQAGLGAYVVNRELQAWTVVAHLGLGMAFAAALIALTVHLAVPEGSPAPPGLRRFLGLTAAAVYLQLLLGSYVTGRHAGLAFQDFPLHNGRIVPEGLGEIAPTLQAGHRLWAYVVAALVMMAAGRTRRALGAGTLTARLARAAAGLVGLQLVIGALNVWTDLNSMVVTSHLAVATFIWGTTWAAYLASGRAVGVDAEPSGPRDDALSVAS